MYQQGLLSVVALDTESVTLVYVRTGRESLSI